MNEKFFVWSILIPTMECREDSFNSLVDNLTGQIERLSLQNKIEIISICDNGDMPIEFKEKYLRQQGEYRAKHYTFLMDNEKIPDNYIETTYKWLNCDGLNANIKQ